MALDKLRRLYKHTARTATRVIDTTSIRLQYIDKGFDDAGRSIELACELALRLGADYALDPTAEGFTEEVIRLTGGGVNVCIEVTGLGAGLVSALDCMKEMGRVALLGCTRSSKFEIDYYGKVHGPGITLIGAHTNARPRHESAEGWWTEADDARAIIRLMQYQRLDLARLVEEIHSPEEAPDIYTRLANSPAFPIIQFDWRKLQ